VSEFIPHDVVVNKSNRKFVLVDYGVLHDTKHFDKVYEKLVYVMLCKYADYYSKTSYPSIPTLARHCMCSENTVRSAIKKLVELKLISVQSRKRQDGSGQTSNLYTLLEIPDTFPKYEIPSQNEGA
jgi:hypothetical protein